MNLQDNKKRSRNIILRTLLKIKQGISLKLACLLPLALLFTPFVSSLHAQNDNLFEHAERGSIDLTERQSELLDIVDARPYTKEIRLVNLRFSESLKNRESLRMNLPADRILDVDKRTVYETDGGPYTWSGMPEEGYASVLLTVNEGNITGKIQTLDFHFNITPLGNGLHALYEIDHSKAPPDHPDVDMEEFSEKKIGGNELRKSVDINALEPEIFNGENYQASSSTSSAIDLLVLYTEAAKNETGDIGDDITNAVAGLMESFSNSNVSANVKVVSTIEVDYQESGFILTDLNRLTDPNSGYMDDIHQTREFLGANLVVLIVATGDACGNGHQHADYELGFSVVRHNCIVPFITLSHEIGHNVGTHHSRTCNLDHDGDFSTTWNTDYQYGHGYNVPADGGKSTIMACGFERVNFWSNPMVDWDSGPIQKLNQKNYEFNQGSPSIPMGTFDYEHNARVWNERSSTVAALAPPEPLSVTLFGETHFGEGNTGMWWASASNGEEPYSFTWFRSYSSSTGPWTQVGTGSSYGQVVNQEKWLRLVVMDSDCNPFCNTAEDVVHIQVNSCGNPPCPMPKMPGGEEALPETLTLVQNYPNPFNPSTTIGYDLPERSDVRLEVFNMLGQRVALLADGQVQPGSHSVVFDASNLSSGTYLLRMDAQGSNGEHFVQSMTMQLVK